jgi:hypothetical protein
MTTSDTSNDHHTDDTTDENSADHTETNASNNAESHNSDGDDGIRKNAVERGLFMLLFGFIGYFAFWAIIILAIVQLVFVLASKEPNAEIAKFSGNLGEYISQVVGFLSFATEEKPCPFAPFPSVATAE